MKLQCFEARVLLHPKEFSKGVVLQPSDEEDTKLISSQSDILAQNQDQARAIAATKIPKEYYNELSRVEVIVRPF